MRLDREEQTAMMATSTPRDEGAEDGGGSVRDTIGAPAAVSETGEEGFDYGRFHALDFPRAMQELLTPTTEPGRSIVWLHARFYERMGGWISLYQLID